MSTKSVINSKSRIKRFELCPLYPAFARRSFSVGELFIADAGKLARTAKNAVAFNRNLEQIQHRGLEIFDELRFSGITFSIDEIVDKLKGKEERPVTLVEYLKSRNEELKEKSGIDITETTYEKYERSLRHVIAFIENK